MADDSTPSQLTCVRVVCQSGPEVLRLPHVAKALNDFVDSSSRWGLVQACRANSLRLARHLIKSNADDPFYDILTPFTKTGLRQWQFSEALLIPASKGNLELVGLLCRGFDGCFVSKEVVWSTIKFDRLEVLQWLVGQYWPKGLIQWWGAELEVGQAIKWGHLEIATWIFEIDGASYVREPLLENWTAIAAESGDLDILQWICGLSENVDPMKVLDKAVSNCHLDVVKWILARAHTTNAVSSEVPFINLDGPAASGHVEMVKWLLHHNRKKCCVNGGDVEAARNGHFEVLRLLHTNNVKRFSGQMLRAAAEGGHLDILKWLHELQTPILAGDFYNATDIAATNGFLDVVKWLRLNTSERATALAIDGAARNDHLETIKWLHSDGADCTCDALYHFARAGNLELVKWLHGHCEGLLHHSRRDIMDDVAMFGHLDVLKWLHHNGSEVCTTAAIDFAAANGHLAVVMWLHHNRSEGSTVAAMDEAARNNHLAVVKWLHEYGLEGSDKAIINAAEGGHVLMVQWLASHGYTGTHPWVRRQALILAVRNGHFDTIRCICTDVGESNELVQVLRGCIESSRLWEFLEWARRNDGPTELELQVASLL